MERQSATVIFDGGVFLESPRWHAGQLWFSDVLSRKVFRTEPNGLVREVCQFADLPSGLGFLPDGRLLVVAMTTRRVLCRTEGTFVIYADLTALDSGTPNDMVVDGKGRAYVGDLGFDLFERRQKAIGRLLLIEPTGEVRVVASDLAYPNGIAISADGETLLVAESDADRLTAFTIDEDGSLTERRGIAQLPAASSPDGLCLDSEGAAWVALFEGDAFLRLSPAGDAVDEIVTPERRAVACVLGDEHRTSLYLVTAETTSSDLREGKSRARIAAVEVEVPGAGSP